jgi:hypothetical protein
MSNKHVQTIYEEIMEVSDKICNEWEIDFLDSIAWRVKYGELTAKQLDTLGRIYRKACSSPF